MQYTPHYNLNLPEGTDIVNPLVQDNPNYTAIDTALYNNKLRVVGTATHVKTGTNHAITLGDSDINQFKFVATGDYATGDTFTVDGVTVTPRIADGSSIPTGAFKINSTVLCILDGTVLNIINVQGATDPNNIILSNGVSVEDALVRGSVQVVADGSSTWNALLNALFALIDQSKINEHSVLYRTDDNFWCALTRKESDNTLHFGSVMNYGTYMRAFGYELTTNNSKFIRCDMQNSGNTNTDNSLSIPGAGTIIRIYY